MIAAKEKTFSPSRQSTFNWSPRGTYVQAAATSNDRKLPTIANAEPVVSRFTQNDFRARKSKKSPIGSTVRIQFTALIQNHQRPRENTRSNRLQLRQPHLAPEMSQYRGYFVPGGVDPEGKNLNDWILKIAGQKIPKAVGTQAGGVLQLALPFVDFSIQAGSATGVFFFPDSCEVAIFSIKSGVVKKLDPNGGPVKIDWEAGVSIEIEGAFHSGPAIAGSANAASFAGIFYTPQVSAGPAVASGYWGVPAANGANWYGGTIGVGAGIPQLPIQAGTVAWNYQLIGTAKIPFCVCLAMINQL